MTITDTQVLSYYYKGASPIPDSPIVISSITAAEFLLIQSPKHHAANYYPILPSRLKHHAAGSISEANVIPRLMFDSKKHAAMGKHRTDQLVLNFNGRMPSFVEFGSVAISQIINDHHYDIYAASISHLGKKHQKKLKEKFDFLANANIQCLAITPSIADVGMNILAQFLDKYSPKQNPRNTINDVLILSTAIEHSVPLLTEDNLLRRFTAELLGAQCSHQEQNDLLIDFTAPEVVDRRRPFESKGYLNRGWQVMERRGAR
jgi:predicted nucleic acid-binding protein